MGRAMRWLKKLLTGKKEGGKDPKVDNAANDGGGVIAARDKRRWSFTKQRNSGVDGAGKRPSVAAVAAAELSQVRPCHCSEEREVAAAVMIQKAFRGYLARKALRALKSLVKLQALVRGYLVRKQAATTLHKLQALMRLQASTSALKKASSRKSIEQDRMVAQETRIKPLAAPPPVVHRRRLSDGTDSNFERSPRIVEMDTCQLRCRSSRMSFRYTPDSSDGVPSVVPLSSPLFFNYRQPSSRLQDHELRHAKTAHNTPRLGALTGYDSPAKCRVPCRNGSPRYMADTASSVAKMRCQSAPRQRQGGAPAAEPRPSLCRAGSRKSPAQLQQDSISLRSSEVSRMEEFEFSDEPTRDYYLDQLW